MKIAYVTSGPRGSGKTMFSKKVMASKPGINLVCEDEILAKLSSMPQIDPYEHNSSFQWDYVREMTKYYLSLSDNACVIFDCMTFYGYARMDAISKLKELGVAKVICWQLNVPVEICLNWFFQKPNIVDFPTSEIIEHYTKYYEDARKIEDEGFDKIFRIDPRYLSDIDKIL